MNKSKLEDLFKESFYLWEDYDKVMNNWTDIAMEILELPIPEYEEPEPVSGEIDL